jgi:hypothetical protein
VTRPLFGEADILEGGDITLRLRDIRELDVRFTAT